MPLSPGLEVYFRRTLLVTCSSSSVLIREYVVNNFFLKRLELQLFYIFLFLALYISIEHIYLFRGIVVILFSSYINHTYKVYNKASWCFGNLPEVRARGRSWQRAEVGRERVPCGVSGFI